MLPLHSRDQLFSAMQDGATVITPNNRLSHQLLYNCFNHLNPASQVRDKVTCLPYTAYLRDLFKKICHRYAHQSHPLLLSSTQQQYLWRHVLHEAQYHLNDGFLNELQSAWQRCQQWHIDIQQASFHQTPATRLFQKVCQTLQTYLNEHHLLTEEQLANYLLGFPELFGQKQVIWACFDDYTPEQRMLQDAMQTQGCQLYHYDVVSIAPKLTTYQYQAQDSQDEYLCLIAWLKQQLTAGTPRIAVVIPELQTTAPRLQRLLEQHFSTSLFNISFGRPLIDYPLITQALYWLALDKKELSNHQARLLLHSPYLHGSRSEWMARTELMQHCKLLQNPRMNFTAFVNDIQLQAPKLAHILQTLSTYPEHATPAAWIQHFKERLMQLGFPGEYALDSFGYQCFQRLMGLLDELGPLSVVTATFSATEALSALRNLAHSTIFQIQKPTTPIQILGLLEASGCVFDAVWVCGITDQCLPQKINLSAFIPLDIQRNHQMPHALASRELHLAQQLIHRLQQGALESIFSYPRFSGDTPHLPSPLISHLPTYALSITETPTLPTAIIAYEEAYRLPLTKTTTLRGGTALLANQAKCPFRAFATHRLHATPVANISAGLDASARGQVVHRIMELVWLTLKNQQTLLSLSTEALNQTIDTAIHQALTPLIHQQPYALSPLVQTVEYARLHRLVQVCLEWERQRPPFEVEALEQTFSFNLAGMEFRVRIDRLDKVATKKWVIDYKSSLPSNKPWNEERPEAPQLLLYALLDEDIDTLLFLQLKAGRVTCNGLSAETIALQGISALKKEERWSHRQTQWQQQLSQLAEEFQAGHCPPTPQRTSTCQQCDFPHLCRVGA